jgi:UDP:flavonoid glycosyltransferase YjiC (YdhE family)
MQQYDLLTPLVQLLQCLKSCVFFIHAGGAEILGISSIFIVPSQ